MKKNINLLGLVCRLIFSLNFSSTLLAQKITKVYTKTVTVPKFSTFEVVNAQALDYEMHGAVSSTGNEEAYILRPGVNNEMPCLIINNYRIATWAKDSIKQMIEIEIVPDKNNPEAASELLNALQISIPQKRKEVYLVDGNMNIKKMELINGFFRKDRNTFILDNGEKYNIRQLVIKSTLYIPKQSNVLLNTDYVGLSLDDLDGKLSINAKYGYLKANDIKEVEGNIQNFNANFKDIEKMTLNASYSSITAATVNHFQIGSTELQAKKKKSTGLFDNADLNNALSFSNKYRIDRIHQLDILDTSNDAFNLGTIEHFNAINSNFSNYHIKKISSIFSINGKNGDITIYDVAVDFKKININNQISTIELNMKNVGNFSVKVASKEKTELRFAKYLMEDTIKTSGASNYFKGDKKSGGIVSVDCEYCEIIIN